VCTNGTAPRPAHLGVSDAGRVVRAALRLCGAPSGVEGRSGVRSSLSRWLLVPRSSAIRWRSGSSSKSGVPHSLAAPWTEGSAAIAGRVRRGVRRGGHPSGRGNGPRIARCRRDSRRRRAGGTCRRVLFVRIREVNGSRHVIVHEHHAHEACSRSVLTKRAHEACSRSVLTKRAHEACSRSVLTSRADTNALHIGGARPGPRRPRSTRRSAFAGSAGPFERRATLRNWGEVTAVWRRRQRDENCGHATIRAGAARAKGGRGHRRRSQSAAFGAQPSSERENSAVRRLPFVRASLAQGAQGGSDRSPHARTGRGRCR
jgi:hypothetical protein